MPDLPGSAPQPPMGSSPATGPVPNRGYEVAAQQKIGAAVKMLEDCVPLVGAASELGQSILKALSTLTKHVPTGTVSPAAHRNTLQQALLKQQQNNQQIGAMKKAAMQPGQQPGQQPGAQMPAVPNVAPM